MSRAQTSIAFRRTMSAPQLPSARMAPRGHANSFTSPRHVSPTSRSLRTFSVSDGKHAPISPKRFGPPLRTLRTPAGPL
jgi:hypothetical protein